MTWRIYFLYLQEKSDVKSRLLCHYQSEDTNSTTSKLLPLIGEILTFLFGLASHKRFHR